MRSRTETKNPTEKFSNYVFFHFILLHFPEMQAREIETTGFELIN